MRNITLIFIFILSVGTCFSQGNSVGTADQFCAGGSGLVFPNVTGNPNATAVGCLYSIPNPAYYFLQIEQPGDLFFTISQETAGGTGLDVDFIAWGPFPSVAAANAAITLTACTPTACPNNTANPTFYPYATDNITDCSFNYLPTEDMTITGALSGQIYVVLITNYSDDPGFITLQQTGGTGTTSCADIPVCGGNFYDNGGAAGSYSNNETTTTTVYPDALGGAVTIDFTSFNVLAGDVLTVYNGPDASYPNLGNVTTAPATFSSTDATGTLTFVFTSNASGVSDGWEANVTCSTPPPPPTCGTNFYDTGGISGNYLNNEARTTTIFPTVAGGTVTVDFTAFNLLAGDVLTVYDSPDTSTLLGTVTGAPSSFSSTNPSGALTFVFTSNSSGLSSGWEANVSCTIPPTCSSFFFDSGGATGDYTNNELITTTFFPDIVGTSITATFTAFDLESGWDYLTVYNGPNNTFPSLGTYSGTNIPGPFTSSDPSGALTFVFDSDGSGIRSGWEASLSCAPYVPPVICGNIFIDSGGSGGNYGPNETIQTTLAPDIPGTAITVTFTSFNTENNWDYLYVYNGPDDSFPSLGVYSGTGLPGPFTSSDPSGSLTFVFESDSSGEYAGWEANITCAPYVPPGCGDSFYDSGGASGDYSNDENTTTTFVPDNAGEFVLVTFTAFNTEATYDELSVYDGPDDSFPLLGVFSGTAIPGPFISSDPSGALTFVFESDGSAIRSGWAANITCYDPCNLLITDTIVPLNADACNLDYTTLTTNAVNTTTPGIVYSESFNNAALPAGWVINSTGTAGGGWSITNSSDAGGTPYEATLAGGFSTAANGNRTLTSPAINIAGQTNLQLNFKQLLDHYSSTYNYLISVQTNLDGAGWINRYQVNPVTNDLGPETRNIDLSALTGNSIRIRFRLNGGAFGLNYWNIDDIILSADGTITPPQITWTPNIGLYTDNTLSTLYAGGFSETVYAVPNGSQIYTATDQNGCSDTVLVRNFRKTWNGSQSTDWYDDDNWTPTGIPTNQNCVVIPDLATTNNNSPIVIGTTPFPPPPGLGRSLRVENDGYMELLQFSNLIISDAIDVEPDGKVILRNGSNLIQITNTGITNSGDIQMQRTVTSLNPQDYVYWSSPVNNFGVANVSPGSNLIYNWIPTITGNGAGNYGNWQATTEVMQPGKGYIIRGVAGTNPETAPAANTVEFTGVPRNGAYQIPITHGNYAGADYVGAGNTMATELDDNWNLIGNPYPSAISADAFITENAGILDGTPDPNTPAIFGTVYLWRHQTAPSSATDPFYSDFVYNYNPNDYIGYNSTGSNPFGFNGNIGAGQAFFVLMDHNATSPSNVVFNNTMRFDSGFAPFDNNEFFRTQENTNRNSNEKHRIWLDLIAPNNTANSILVGYIQNATNDFDRLFDGFELSETSNRFYSLINTEEMAIQGRTLPFDDADLVPLGVEIASSGNYSIALNTIDGLFQDTNQFIFIEDTYTNIIHNVRISPYSFNTEAGVFNDRFILRYTDNSLSVEEFNANSGITITAPNSNYIKVSSKHNTIKSVYVCDMLGRELVKKLNINTTEIILDNNSFSEGTYIVKATTTNNMTRIEKVILKR
ncbi:CUB domain-containing protein [Bizionia sp.]|uniref:CUB domain-containing protein n=1 Tax=Bizionia sp. TaxID=1954480 RepID=UPI003A8E1BF3